MTPVEYVITTVTANRHGWKDPQEQIIADTLCDLLKEVARTRARYYPKPNDGDGINSWRDQARMLEGDLLNWLIPFVISRFADPRCTNQSEIMERLVARLELYRSLEQDEVAA